MYRCQEYYIFNTQEGLLSVKIFLRIWTFHFSYVVIWCYILVCMYLSSWSTIEGQSFFITFFVQFFTLSFFHNLFYCDSLAFLLLSIVCLGCNCHELFWLLIFFLPFLTYMLFLKLTSVTSCIQRQLDTSCMAKNIKKQLEVRNTYSKLNQIDSVSNDVTTKILDIYRVLKIFMERENIEC